MTSPTNGSSRKSPARAAAERVLQATTEALTAHQIIESIDWHPDPLEMRRALGNMANDRHIERLAPLPGTRHNRYRWRRKTLQPVTTPTRAYGTGSYSGAAPHCVRPGGMQAFAAPSLHNGCRIERVRPVLLASSAPQGPVR